LFRERFDPRRGLVTSAYTADWGDVSPLYPDQRAIYLDPGTPVVAGIYTNALAYRAALRMRAMLDATGDRVRAAYWSARAAALRAAANRHLWQERAGYYRMHLPVAPERPFFADDHIFAMGGNALAVLSGLADDAQARRIFETAERRRREHRISSIAAVLLPPFPPGVFQHPIMAEPWTYQNGGQWDWFAGRLVLAEFERGRSRAAREHLLAIAERTARAGGFHEWYTREGAGKGSGRYAGGAAAVGQSILEGLFGVSRSGGALELRLRLGGRSARLRLRSPATGVGITLEQDWDARARRLSVDVASEASTGRLAVLLPQGMTVRQALRGREPVAVAVETVGEDRFAVVETRWDAARVVLELRNGF
jgi:hypothetical protein